MRRQTSRWSSCQGVRGTGTLRDGNRGSANGRSAVETLPDRASSSAALRLLGLESHLRDELLDAAANLVADRTDRVDAEALRVVEHPVLVALPRIDGARVATAHGDADVGGADDLVGPRLGELSANVDPDFGLRVDGGRIARAGGPAAAPDAHA